MLNYFLCVLEVFVFWSVCCEVFGVFCCFFLLIYLFVSFGVLFFVFFSFGVLFFLFFSFGGVFVFFVWRCLLFFLLFLEFLL